MVSPESAIGPENVVRLIYAFTDKLDLKRLGFIIRENHNNLIGLEKVNDEQALIMTVYNFKRVLSILEFKGFMDALKKWKPNYK